MSENTRVTQLPPTLGVKDPEVRAFLDALVNAWDHRSGNTDSESDDRFITKGEFARLAESAVVGVLSAAVPGSSLPGLPSGPPSDRSVGEIIAEISNEIRDSLLYKLLSTEFPLIDVKALSDRLDNAFSLAEKYFKDANTLIARETKQRESALESVTEVLEIQASRLADAEAAIVSESTTRATADLAMTSQIATQGSRIAASEAAILNEKNTRATRDTALASAINTIWANIGDTSAVIQDGELATVSPSGALATKWSQVQAEVIDPNTGLKKVTALRQDFGSYASKTDSALYSFYTVKTLLPTGGFTATGIASAPSAPRNVAGSNAVRLSGSPLGFAAGMYLYGVGVPTGARITSVSGNDLYFNGTLLSNASGTYTGSTSRMLVGGFGLAAEGNGSGGTVDFGVLASRFYVAGIDGSGDFPFIVRTGAVNPGVYIKSAFIENAAIDTLKLAGESVIVPRIAEQVVTTDLSTSYTGNICSVSIPLNIPSSDSATLSIICAHQVYPSESTDTNFVTGIFINGTLNTEIGATLGSSGISVVNIGSITVPGGTHTVSIRVRCNVNPNGAQFKPGNTILTRLVVMGAKR